MCKKENNYKKSLIGYPYYIYYKQILKIVLSSTLFGIILSELINIFLNNKTINILNITRNIFEGILLAFSFVTIFFAFLYHKNIKYIINNLYNFLKPINKKNKYKSIISISVSIIFLLLLLLAPKIFSFHIDNLTIEIFNSKIIKHTCLFPIFSTILFISKKIMKLININNIILLISLISINILLAIISSLWLLLYQVINTNFLSILEMTQNILNNFQVFCLICILFALLIDSINSIIQFKNSSLNQ